MSDLRRKRFSRRTLLTYLPASNLLNALFLTTDNEKILVSESFLEYCQEQSRTWRQGKGRWARPNSRLFIVQHNGRTKIQEKSRRIDPAVSYLNSDF